MVDTTKAIESSYVNVDLIKASPTKIAVILDEAQFKEKLFEGKKYEQLEMTVEIDGKKKFYSPNKDSAANIANVWGRDSKYWVGKIILFQVVKNKNKENILALPNPSPSVSNEVVSI